MSPDTNPSDWQTQPPHTDLRIPLTLVVDGAKVREWYAEYTRDVAYYRDHGELDPAHPDQGYATGIPYTWEEYSRMVVDGIIEGELADGFSYTVVRA